MSELDRAKEYIAYLKLWLGAMVVTDLTLMGWLASNIDTAATHRVVLAATAVVIVAVVIFAVHRNIERRIDALRDL